MGTRRKRNAAYRPTVAPVVADGAPRAGRVVVRGARVAYPETQDARQARAVEAALRSGRVPMAPVPAGRILARTRLPTRVRLRVQWWRRVQRAKKLDAAQPSTVPAPLRAAGSEAGRAKVREATVRERKTRRAR